MPALEGIMALLILVTVASVLFACRQIGHNSLLINENKNLRHRLQKTIASKLTQSARQNAEIRALEDRLNHEQAA